MSLQLKKTIKELGTLKERARVIGDGMGSGVVGFGPFGLPKTV